MRGFGPEHEVHEAGRPNSKNLPPTRSTGSPGPEAPQLSDPTHFESLQNLSLQRRKPGDARPHRTER